MLAIMSIECYYTIMICTKIGTATRQRKDPIKIFKENIQCDTPQYLRRILYSDGFDVQRASQM